MNSQPKGALAEQVDGDHYKKLKIQPIQYSMANNLNACQHSIIKYATRYKDKGKLKDLKKIIHFTNLLIQIEGWDKPEESDNEQSTISKVDD